jgi:hypothetical protein
MAPLPQSSDLDPNAIIASLLSSISQLKPQLSRDEKFLLERIEDDLHLIQSMEFDKSDAVQARRLYLAMGRLDEIQTNGETIAKLKTNVTALQQQQHPYFILMLKSMSALENIKGLSSGQQKQLILLQEKIINKFNDPNTSPEEKLTFIVDAMKNLQLASASSLTLLGGSQLSHSLKEIIISLSNIQQTPRPTFPGG